MIEGRALASQRALVVGGSSGIGLASARALAVDGAEVTITGRDEDRLARAVESLGSGVRGLACDAMDGASVAAAVKAAGGDAGLDIAVSVPGGGSYSRVLDYEDDVFLEQVGWNVQPAFLALKHAGRAMRDAGGGSIVLISSTSAVLSSPYLAAYCAGKAAVDQLVRVAADELGEKDVRVNAVRPGLTHTDATDPMFQMPETLEAFLEQQPLARHGEPEDIARAVRYLAGPESSWVTGQCLTVDGGHTLRRFPDMAALVP